ncbi:UNKNOWN [Stylonychia lemnae]|uniref:Cyclin-like domain-containing protein n=1 Tax=Stylonychia lemnae TaxID=5949 RepID=A0A078A6I7_STYLE|nr:UNKNOWN [Stylonychia lemnae]|eukprot:CDW77195.1 UNKNOWN [Stylonychia lemnae]
MESIRNQNTRKNYSQIKANKRQRDSNSREQGQSFLKPKVNTNQCGKDAIQQVNSILIKQFQNDDTASTINAQKKKQSQGLQQLQEKVLTNYQYRENVKKNLSQNIVIDYQIEETLKIGEILRLQMVPDYLNLKNGITQNCTEEIGGCQNNTQYSNLLNEQNLYLKIIEQQAVNSQNDQLRQNSIIQQEVKEQNLDIYADQQGLNDNNFYHYHSLTLKNRVKMVDWMLQVMRVLKIESQKTFIQAIKMMDKYYEVKMKEGKAQPNNEFHLIGLVCIYISSKFEEVEPITLKEIVNDAAHKKFTKKQIIEKEQSVLQTLQFKIKMDDIFEESNSILEQCFHQSNILQKSNEEYTNLKDVVQFLCQLIPHNLELIQLDVQILRVMVVQIALKLRKFSLNQYIYENLYGETLIVRDKSKLQNLKKIEDFSKFFKCNILMMTQYNKDSLNKVYLKKLAALYLDITYGQPQRKNLRKNWPSLFDEKTQEFFRQIQDKYSD